LDLMKWQDAHWCERWVQRVSVDADVNKAVLGQGSIEPIPECCTRVRPVWRIERADAVSPPLCPLLWVEGAASKLTQNSAVPALHNAREGRGVAKPIVLGHKRTDLLVQILCAWQHGERQE
jgi:hypothetical protein